MIIYLLNASLIPDGFTKQDVISKAEDKNKIKQLERVKSNDVYMSACVSLLYQKVLEMPDNGVIGSLSSNEQEHNDSISYSFDKNVAVLCTDESGKPCGISVALLDETKLEIYAKTFNPQEKEEYASITPSAEKTKFVFRTLTTRNAFLKMNDCEADTQNVKDYTGAKFVTKYIFDNSDVYCITVCSENIEKLRFNCVRLSDLLNG